MLVGVGYYVLYDIFWLVYMNFKKSKDILFVWKKKCVCLSLFFISIKIERFCD